MSNTKEIAVEGHSFPSRYKIGEIAYFQPVLEKILWSHEHQTYLIGDGAIPVLVVGVTFVPGKVLYDIAVPDAEGGFYEHRPLCRVDSILVHGKDSAELSSLIKPASKMQ